VIETTFQRGNVFPRIRPWLGIAAAASFVVASVMALFWAPTDAVQGNVYRILYVHVPLAWLAYLAFVVVFLASVGWLWTKNSLFDAIAVSSAEIGVLFTGLFLVAGSIWAKPTWGVWWTWEPRLVTTAIMFVMYVGYLLLRGLSTDTSHRGHRRPHRPPLGALGELASPASDGAAGRRLPRARLVDAADAHGLARRVHAHLRVLHDSARLARARAPQAAMDNLIFIVAAFAIVWGALLAYLISLRARGA